MAPDNDKEQRLIEANNQGQEDGARWRDQQGSFMSAAAAQAGLLVYGDFYNPPNDPEEKEAYYAGFHNAAG